MVHELVIHSYKRRVPFETNHEIFPIKRNALFLERNQITGPLNGRRVEDTAVGVDERWRQSKSTSDERECNR
jgi:hypothetical protein